MSRLAHSARKINAQRAVFAGDFHVPYHDPLVVDLFLDFLDWFKPDVLFLNGDFVDFYQLSKFSQDPKRLPHLQQDLDIGQNILSRISEAAPDARKIYLAGNHEARLERYCWENAKALSSLRDLTVRGQLGLQKYHFEYRDYGEPFTWHGLMVEHGNRVSVHSAYTCKVMLEYRGVSGISNHTHRLGSHYRTNYNGTQAWWENGCMCLLEGFDFTHGLPNWQQGFSVAYAPEDGTRFFLEQVPVLSGRILYGGVMWGRKPRE